MKHDFIDKYSTLDSSVHRLDPRTKVLFSLLFLVIVTSVASIPSLVIYLLFALVLVIISKVPLHFFIEKIMLITPLAFLFSTFIYISYLIEHSRSFSISMFSIHYSVLDTIVPIIMKIYISVLIVTLLVSSTRFNDLLWALRKLKFPSIVTTLSKLVYTYIFLFIDEMHRTMRAYRSRTPIRRISRIKAYGSITAGILTRSMNRSEYIYKAMMSRGFSGEFPECRINRFKSLDIIALFLFLAIIILEKFISWKM